MEPENDRDLYPWIIRYIWKIRNDKLFRGIDRDHLELVRYVESECQAWHNANITILSPLQAQSDQETQALSFGEICMVDGSWTSIAQFNRTGWVWEDSLEKIQLMGTRNMQRRESAVHLELETLKWTMESMLQHSNCQKFGTDCKDILATVSEP